MPVGAVSRPGHALSGWPADGLLELVAEPGPGGRTFLSGRRQRFPLRLTAPLYLDQALPGMAFVYVQNPTGGLFEGDDLTLSLTARPQAQVHLTTQAATKAYRAETTSARQRVELEAGAGAFVEYLPDPLIPHAGARVEQDVVARVHPEGAMILAETVTPGRVASGETFRYRSLSLSTRIARHDAREAIDRLVLQPDELNPRSPGMLGSYSHLVSLFAVGPEDDAEPLAGSISDALEDVPGCLAATSILPSGSGVLARILAPSSIPAQRALRAAWGAARLGLAGAHPPRSRK